MTLVDAIIYGLIQAVCEFLPVSSSGHLALLPKYLKIQDPGVTFDLYLHIGTIFSLLLYFRKEVMKIASAKIEIFKKPSKALEQKGYNAYVVNMILATLFSIIFILIFKPLSENYGRNPQVIAFNLAFFGALLYFADIKGGEKFEEELEKVNWKFALALGFSQAIAIFPGVSRSGATLSMGRWLKFDRKVIAEFTFLLSIPIVAMGSAYKALKIIQGAESLQFDLFYAFIGILVSFFIGLLVIHYFLKLIKKIPFWTFFLYRVLLAMLIIS